MKEPQFTGDWFESLINGIKSNAGNVGEHRNSPRVGVTMTVDMGYARSGQIVRDGVARLRNVSRTGAGFTVNKRLKPATQFCLSFPRMDEPPLIIGYEVVHCRMVADRVHSVGARLLWIGTPPETETQAAQPAAEPEEVRRIRQAMLR